MKNLDLTGIAFFIAVAVGFYSCNRYGTTSNSVSIEQEKTKQIELQLKLKGCQ